MTAYLNAHTAGSNQIKTNKIMNDITDCKTVVLCTVVAAVCLLFGYVLGASDVRRDAIKHNAAKWFAEEDGSPKFTWGQ